MKRTIRWVILGTVMTGVWGLGLDPVGHPVCVKAQETKLKTENEGLRKTLAGKNRELELLEVANKELRETIEFLKKGLEAERALRIANFEAHKKVEAKLKAALQKAEAQKKLADLAVTKRAEEVRKLIDILAKLKAENADALAKVQNQNRKFEEQLRIVRDLKVLTVKTQQEKAALLQRNEQLLKRIRELENQLPKSKGQKTSSLKKGQPNPPNVSVEGTVKKVSKNLVELSAGSDAGLKKGHTLEIFRTKPQPTYLGRVQVIEVSNRSAIGQILPTPGRNVEVRPGDFFTSQLSLSTNRLKAEKE